MPRSSAVLIFLLEATARADDLDRLKVGVQPDGRVVVPTNQILQPAGRQVVCPGRPVDLLPIDGGKALVVKYAHELVFVDVATATVKQTLPTPRRGREQPGLSAVGLAGDGDRVFVSDSPGNVRVARRGADCRYAWDKV